jgi:hypothetical protein
LRTGVKMSTVILLLSSLSSSSSVNKDVEARVSSLEVLGWSVWKCSLTLRISANCSRHPGDGQWMRSIELSLETFKVSSRIKTLIWIYSRIYKKIFTIIKSDDIIQRMKCMCVSLQSFDPRTKLSETNWAIGPRKKQ